MYIRIDLEPKLCIDKTRVCKTIIKEKDRCRDSIELTTLWVAGIHLLNSRTIDPIYLKHAYLHIK